MELGSFGQSITELGFTNVSELIVLRIANLSDLYTPRGAATWLLLSELTVAMR